MKEIPRQIVKLLFNITYRPKKQLYMYFLIFVKCQRSLVIGTIEYTGACHVMS